MASDHGGRQHETTTEAATRPGRADDLGPDPPRPQPPRRRGRVNLSPRPDGGGRPEPDLEVPVWPARADVADAGPGGRIAGAGPGAGVVVGGFSPNGRKRGGSRAADCFS